MNFAVLQQTWVGLEHDQLPTYQLYQIRQAGRSGRESSRDIVQRWRLLVLWGGTNCRKVFVGGGEQRLPTPTMPLPGPRQQLPEPCCLQL